MMGKQVRGKQIRGKLAMGKQVRGKYGGNGNRKTGKGKMGWGWGSVGKKMVWVESERGKVETDQGEQVMGDQGDR